MAGGGFPTPSPTSKNDSSHAASDDGPVPPFPLFKSVILAMVLVNESLCANMLLPFIGLFVAHLQGTTPEEAGFASGFLVAVFQLGQVFSGKKWGALSDKYGRKPALQLGLVFSGTVMLLFGLCSNIYMGVLLRLIHGLVNGNILVAKAMMPEVMGHKVHEPKGYAIPSMTWCLGTLIGPAIGGALYDPTRYEWFPLRSDSIFGKNPALLPSLVIGLYSFFALGICTFFLPETNANAKKMKLIGKRKLNDDENSTSGAGANKDTSAPAQPKIKFGYKQAFQNPLTRAVLILYMIISFADIAFFEILPLWAVSGRAYGGLSMPSETVGLIILINGLPGMFANLMFSTVLNKFGGPTNVLRIGTTLWILTAFGQPYAHYFEGNTCLIVLSFFLIVRVVGAAWSFSPNFLLIGRSAPPGHLGSINGIAQSLGCVTRTVAPLLVAPLYAWSITGGHPYPFNFHLAFIVGWMPILANYKLAAMISRHPQILGLPPTKEVNGALEIEPPTNEDYPEHLGIVSSSCLLHMQLEDIQRFSAKENEDFSIIVSSDKSPTTSLQRRGSKAHTPVITPLATRNQTPLNDSLARRPHVQLGPNDSFATRRNPGLPPLGSSFPSGAARVPLASSQPRRMFLFGTSPSIDPEMILIESESEPQRTQNEHQSPTELSI